jgi:hypothetical protein
MSTRCAPTVIANTDKWVKSDRVAR